MCVCVRVDAGVCGRPAMRLLDVSVVSDRWSQGGGRFGWWMVAEAEGGSVFDSTANLSLLDPEGSGDHATSHYSKNTHPSSSSSLSPSLLSAVCPYCTSSS